MLGEALLVVDAITFGKEEREAFMVVEAVECIVVCRNTFAVRTITFRSIFLFKMHNGHALPHNFSLQQMAKFLPVSIAQMVVFTRIAKSYESENFEK
jgi:hypothetical protein